MLQIFADFLAILGRQCLKFLNSLQPLGLLVLRVALGVIFLTHGYPKLTHTSGALGAMFVQHGLPAYFVYVAGVLETFGSLLLVLGLFTRGAALCADRRNGSSHREGAQRPRHDGIARVRISAGFRMRAVRAGHRRSRHRFRRSLHLRRRQFQPPPPAKISARISLIPRLRHHVCRRRLHVHRQRRQRQRNPQNHIKQNSRAAE